MREIDRFLEVQFGLMDLGPAGGAEHAEGNVNNFHGMCQTEPHDLGSSYPCLVLRAGLAGGVREREKDTLSLFLLPSADLSKKLHKRY